MRGASTLSYIYRKLVINSPKLHCIYFALNATQTAFMSCGSISVLESIAFCSYVMPFLRKENLDKQKTIIN